MTLDTYERKFIEQRIRDLTRQRDESRMFLMAAVAAYGELRIPEHFLMEDFSVESFTDFLTNERVFKAIPR